MEPRPATRSSGRGYCSSYGNSAVANWIGFPSARRRYSPKQWRTGGTKEKGGFYNTLDWDGAPLIRDRYWWPYCEGVGASAFLNDIDGDPSYEHWYRRIWSFIATRFIDRQKGGWRAQLNDTLQPNSGPFFDKVDIYHSLQTLPTTGSVTRGLLGIGRKGVS
jgi:mannose/cellobiose epimerase-like protein (N-acyl-D-glucosamine 2-epimerase family)